MKRLIETHGGCSMDDYMDLGSQELAIRLTNSQIGF